MNGIMLQWLWFHALSLGICLHIHVQSPKAPCNYFNVILYNRTMMVPLWGDKQTVEDNSDIEIREYKAFVL